MPLRLPAVGERRHVVKRDSVAIDQIRIARNGIHNLRTSCLKLCVPLRHDGAGKLHQMQLLAAVCCQRFAVVREYFRGSGVNSTGVEQDQIVGIGIAANTGRDQAISGCTVHFKHLKRAVIQAACRTDILGAIGVITLDHDLVASRAAAVVDGIDRL